jgi:hypothetical protein
MTLLKLEHYDCPSCGAAIDFVEQQLSATCSFCASPLVRHEQASEAPALISKFMIERAAASHRIQHFLSEHLFVPKELKAKARPDSLHGIYLPFWLVDAQAESDYDAEIGIHWYETIEEYKVQNGKRVRTSKTVQRTEWHRLQGSYGAEYEKYLVSGSQGLSQQECLALQPFDIGQALDFDLLHLSGWISESFTKTIEDAAIDVREGLQQKQQVRIAQFLPGDTHRALAFNLSIEVEAIQTIFLPIWIATYAHKKSPVRILVNGQTGEIVGHVPKDWKSIALSFLLLGLIFGILLFIAGQ